MTENKNPFLKPYNTPHDTAPFHLIKIEHYEPALLQLSIIPKHRLSKIPLLLWKNQVRC